MNKSQATSAHHSSRIQIALYQEVQKPTCNYSITAVFCIYCMAQERKREGEGVGTYICCVPEVDPYQSMIGTALLYQKSIDIWYSYYLYQKSIDFWYSYYLYQKSIDFWYSTNCTRSRSTFGTALSCTRSRSSFGTALTVPKVDRLLGQPLRLYQSTIGTGLFIRSESLVLIISLLF